jgi:hypothetical protein
MGGNNPLSTHVFNFKMHSCLEKINQRGVMHHEMRQQSSVTKGGVKMNYKFLIPKIKSMTL